MKTLIINQDLTLAIFLRGRRQQIDHRPGPCVALGLLRFRRKRFDPAVSRKIMRGSSWRLHVQYMRIGGVVLAGFLAGGCLPGSPPAHMEIHAQPEALSDDRLRLQANLFLPNGDVVYPWRVDIYSYGPLVLTTTAIPTISVLWLAESADGRRHTNGLVALEAPKIVEQTGMPNNMLLVTMEANAAGVREWIEQALSKDNCTWHVSVWVVASFSNRFLARELRKKRGVVFAEIRSRPVMLTSWTFVPPVPAQPNGPPSEPHGSPQDGLPAGQDDDG